MEERFFWCPSSNPCNHGSETLWGCGQIGRDRRCFRREFSRIQKARSKYLNRYPWTGDYDDSDKWLVGAQDASLLPILFALVLSPIFLAGAFPLLQVKAGAEDGLITIQSHFGPKETMQRLEAAVKAKGFAVFAHVDHSAEAAQVKLSLPPTDLLIFGNPKGGTPLMRASQTIGIDLPLKALVWQDDKGTTWLSYNDPEWIVRRHDGAPGAEDTIRTISGALKMLAANATSAE